VARTARRLFSNARKRRLVAEADRVYRGFEREGEWTRLMLDHTRRLVDSLPENPAGTTMRRLLPD
jgi:hypothetical protein